MYKFTKVHRLNLGLAKMGKPSGMLGKTAWNKGLPAPWTKGSNNTNWGKFGPAHPKWTGRTKLTKSIRMSVPYKNWRFAIFKRDNFTCQVCGINGVYLEADHFPVSFAEILNQYEIKTFESAMNCQLLWDISNGRTVCSIHNPRPGRLSKKDC